MKIFGKEFNFNLLSKEPLKSANGHAPLPISNKPMYLYDASSNLAFHTCVKIISNYIASNRYAILDSGDNEREYNTFFYVLNVRPNRHQTITQFWQYVVTTMVMKGDCIVYIKWRDDGLTVDELIPLNSAFLTVYVDDIKALDLSTSVVYKYSNPDTGESLTLKPEEVLHFRYGIGQRGFRGTPALIELANTLGLAMDADNEALSTLKQGFNGTLVMQLASDLSVTKRIEVAKDLKKITDNANVGKFLPLPPGVDCKPIAGSLSTSDYALLKKMTAQEICGYFGVPAFMVMDTSGVGQASLGSQQLNAFYHSCLKPMINDICEELTYKLLTFNQQNGKKLRFVSNDNGAIDLLDPASRISAYAQLKGIGVLTSNEIRAELVYPASKDEGADTLTTASYMGGLSSTNESKNTNNEQREKD